MIITRPSFLPAPKVAHKSDRDKREAMRINAKPKQFRTGLAQIGEEENSIML